MRCTLTELFTGFQAARTALRDRRQADEAPGNPARESVGMDQWRRVRDHNIALLEGAMNRLETRLGANPVLDSDDGAFDTFPDGLGGLTMALAAGWQQTAVPLSALLSRIGDVNGLTFGGPETRVADSTDLQRRLAELTAQHEQVAELQTRAGKIGLAQRFVLAALETTTRAR